MLLLCSGLALAYGAQVLLKVLGLNMRGLLLACCVLLRVLLLVARWEGLSCEGLALAHEAQVLGNSVLCAECACAWAECCSCSVGSFWHTKRKCVGCC